MFKKLLTLFVLVAFMLPTMAQAWGSHSFKHTIHNAFETHHQVPSTNHIHAEHSHAESAIEPNIHNPTIIGMGTYFKDYLHVDISSHTNKLNGIKKAEPAAIDHLPFIQAPTRLLPAINSPPGYNSHLSPISQNNIYFQTQRLRI